MLKELNDNELVILANENNEEAEKLLIDKYSSIIKMYVNNNLKRALFIGMDEKDLYQEGLLGLMYAIKNFDREKNVTFYTYVCLCVDTNIRSAIRSANRYKSKILNESISLDEFFEDEESNLYNILKDESNDPSIKIIEKEHNDKIFKLLNDRLAEFEKKILNFKLQGLSNKEIAVILGKDRRSVENTIGRIRNKYKEIKDL